MTYTEGLLALKTSKFRAEAHVVLAFPAPTWLTTEILT